MDDSNNLKNIAMMNHRIIIRSLQLKKVCYKYDRVTLYYACHHIFNILFKIIRAIIRYGTGFDHGLYLLTNFKNL